MTLKGIKDVLRRISLSVMISLNPIAELAAVHKADPPEPVVYEERKSSKGSIEANLSWISFNFEWESSLGKSSEREDEK